MDDRRSRTVLKMILLGCAIVTVIDVFGSVISTKTHAAYAWFGIATFVTYVALGYRSARGKSLLTVAVIGLVVCTYDATVGWGISALLGPGNVALSGVAPRIAVIVTV